ncbi:unnamed protein product [Triticum turgidum subsp. durum]|uniref:ATP-dependent DNA helicase n=1 Tax=Triticum turgidum subsp. durum TaxID=4567 RepID=A0A9R0W4G1_TRITD|nr:unnamed protein product [Triticum turgidum subsp. durum]
MHNFHNVEHNICFNAPVHCFNASACLSEFCCCSLISCLQAVYKNVPTRYSDVDYLKERAILTPTNEVAEKINECVLSLVPTSEREYLSRDTIGNSADAVRNQDAFYPVEQTIIVNIAFGPFCLISFLMTISTHYKCRSAMLFKLCLVVAVTLCAPPYIFYLLLG